jgi:hypothetical protein
MKEHVLCKMYKVIGKNMYNKTVYFKQTVVLTPKTLARKSEEGHCHAVKLRPNRKVTTD